MKHLGDITKINLCIKRITYNETKPFLLGVHYARRMPCVQYAFGLFLCEKLIGVVTYGQPASPSLCKGVAGEKNRKNVIELNRLVFLPGYNQKNYASYLVGNTLKMLPNRTFVVSYADWGGGGITLDMFTKLRIFTSLALQNQEQINIRSLVIQDITQRMRKGDNHVVQNTDTCTWLGIRGKRNPCLMN